MRFNVSKEGVKLIKNITSPQLIELIKQVVTDRNYNTGMSDLGGVLLNMVERLDGIVAGSGDPIVSAEMLATGVLRITLDSGTQIDTAGPVIGASFRAKDLADAAAVNALTNNLTGDTAHVIDSDTLTGGSAGVEALVHYTGAAWEVVTLLSVASASKALDTATSTTVDISAKRSGGAAGALDVIGPGIYRWTATAGADTERIEITGNNTNLRPDNAFEFRFNNSANAENREWLIQVKSLTNNQVQDLAALGINPQQTIVGNVTTIIFSGMNGFSSNGYQITLR